MNYDDIIIGTFNIAISTAMEMNHGEITPYHFYYGLIKNNSSFTSKNYKNDKTKCLGKLKELPVLKNLNSDEIIPSNDMANLITLASADAASKGQSKLTESNFLKFLQRFISWFDPSLISVENEMPDFLTDLNDLAIKGKLDPVIGRSFEIRSLIEILSRRNKNNPVLVGNAGVGKTAIVEGLADAICKGKVPTMIKDKKILALSMGQLISGTKYRGEFEERMQKLLKYIKQEPNTILFIDELHLIVGAGNLDGSMDAANLLKPALARGELRCIGATTLDEYNRYILKDPALERRFRSIMVEEPSKEDALEIVLGIRNKLEIHHGIKISDEALYASVFLSDQYISDKYLPDKAIDLLDEAAASLKLSAETMPRDLEELASEVRSKRIYQKIAPSDNLQIEIQKMEEEFNQKKADWDKKVLEISKVSSLKNELDHLQFALSKAELSQDYEEASIIKYSKIPKLTKELEQVTSEWILKEDDIASVISRVTGIPVEKIKQGKQENILQLEKYLNKSIYGQQDAISEITKSLMVSYAGLADKNRPLGSFLLKGPTGVGKTETVKQIATFLFNQKNLIRLDMSEYSEKHAVAKLIGAPAGYIGYEEGGILTEAVRRHPYSVILFDEIEKSHPDFADILLQITSDGRLTDNKGRVISFKNTIIFLTTNSSKIENDFKSELLGRLIVITYQKLNSEIMSKLIEKEVTNLNTSLISKGITVKLTDNLIKELSLRGFDDTYGARPLQQVFDKIVVRPLAHKLLGDKLTKGDYIIDYNSDQLLINKN